MLFGRIGGFWVSGTALKTGRQHLFLAPDENSWGEIILGMRIARQLQAAGDYIVFVAHRASARLFEGAEFDVEFLNHGPDSRLTDILGRRVQGQDVSSVVLCDFNTTSVYLEEQGLSPEILLCLDIPVIAVDTWDFSRTGHTMDMQRGKKREINTWVDRLDHRLLPVPIIQPNPIKGAYANLPRSVRAEPSTRHAFRNSLGLARSDRVILLTTASWQDAEKGTDEAKRLAEAVPRLLAHYVSLLGSAVHLVHIAPTEYPLREYLGDRYHWIQPLGSKAFSDVLGSVDLLVSSNISATTITKAIVSHLPVVVLTNTISGAEASGVVSSLDASPTRFVSRWIEEVVPLRPFVVWPIGGHKFLAPLLLDNSYCSAFELLELLDQAAIKETCYQLLFSREAKDELRHRQDKYMTSVRALPSGAEAIEACL